MGRTRGPSSQTPRSSDGETIGDRLLRGDSLDAADPQARPAAGLPAILFVAGFGDGAEMFAALAETALAARYRLLPIDLPGFAGTPAIDGPTSLDALAEIVHDHAVREHARIVVAHSVASIIASLAARRHGSPIDTILSLEGNLTASDAYFSGTAADYADPRQFRDAFLRRLDDMADSRPIFRRYREIVGRADPQALWDLGCDARRFSQAHVPGELLRETDTVWYLYNPDNCPPSTLEWLRGNPINTIKMDGASHWPSVDQPDRLAQNILDALGHG